LLRLPAGAYVHSRKNLLNSHGNGAKPHHGNKTGKYDSQTLHGTVDEKGGSQTGEVGRNKTHQKDTLNSPSQKGGKRPEGTLTAPDPKKWNFTKNCTKGAGSRKGHYKEMPRELPSPCRLSSPGKGKAPQATFSDGDHKKPHFKKRCLPPAPSAEQRRKEGK